MEIKDLRFETRQIHAGLNKHEKTGSRGVAIYPTAAYRFSSCDQAARLFELTEPGNIYTRLQNPTTTSYEERITALYGATGALALSSGMSAILIAITALASQGENIVASPLLYGGTYNQFRHTLRILHWRPDFHEPPLSQRRYQAVFLSYGISLSQGTHIYLNLIFLNSITQICHNSSVKFAYSIEYQ